MMTIHHQTRPKEGESMVHQRDSCKLVLTVAKVLATASSATAAAAAAIMANLNY